MRKQKRIYKERLIHFFTCSECGRVNSQSYSIKKKRNGICAKCRRGESKVNKDQLSLI